jgi:hypothetical protein
MKTNKTLAVLLALSFCAFAPSAFGGGWGIERGRADGGDVARLLVDQLAMKMARNRITDALQRPLVEERQRQLLEKSQGGYAADELLDDVYDWWFKDVMGPSEAIASNPAASCEEAKIAVQSVLTMMGQRQLLGISADENDKSERAEKLRAREAQLNEIFESTKTKLTTRCREEALDECIATGRAEQIVQTELGFARGNELIGEDSQTADNWVDSAFKQCAIYELHFVSTTKVPQIFNLTMVRDTKIKLEFDVPNGILNAIRSGTKLADMLKGETKGGANPFFISVKCSQPPLNVVCTGGDNLSPFKARVFKMELKHREFYVDPAGISRERMVGEDKFIFELAEGIYGVDAVVKVPRVPPVPVPMKAIGFSFYTAHKKDRVEERPAVKVERNKRGVYPVIFDFTYADQDSESNASASDSTEFKLIHKPKPNPIVHIEPTRKPLKPSTRIKRVGG